MHTKARFWTGPWGEAEVSLFFLASHAHALVQPTRTAFGRYPVDVVVLTAKRGVVVGYVAAAVIVQGHVGGLTAGPHITAAGAKPDG